MVPQHSYFKGTIVSDYGDLILTKSSGIKNICQGKLGFCILQHFIKGNTPWSDWAAVYKENTYVFDSNRFYPHNISTFMNNCPLGGVFLSPQFMILRLCDPLNTTLPLNHSLLPVLVHHPFPVGRLYIDICWEELSKPSQNHKTL